MAGLRSAVDPERISVVLGRVSSTDAHYPISIPATEGERLRHWVAHVRAQETIEIGLGFGVSALFVCAALAASGGGRHLAIDPYQKSRFQDQGLRLLDEAGAGEILELRREPSETVLPALLAHDRQFDLAFVDGNHRFDWVFVDLVYLGQLVRPGGVVFVDDYHLPAIRKAVSFFVANLGWAIEELSEEDPHHGWVVLRTALEPDERDFTHFVDF